MKVASNPIAESVSHTPESTPRHDWRARVVRLLRLEGSLGKGFCSVLDQCVVSGTSFVTSVVIGRSCPQDELGLYYLALSLVLFARAIQADSVTTPYMIYCNRREGRNLALYAGSSFTHQAILTAITAVGLWVLIGALTWGFGPAALSPTVWVLIGSIPFLLLREHIRGFMFAHLHWGSAIAIDSAVAALQLGGLALLAWFRVLTVETVYLVMGIACAAACLAWFLIQRQLLAFAFASATDDWRHNWRFSKWALSSQLVGRLSSYVMPWIVVLMHGEAATGMLAACTTLVNLSGTFVTGVSNFLTPKAAHAYAHDGAGALRKLLWMTAALFTLTIGLISLLTLVAGERIAVLVYGDQYRGAGPILAALTFAMLANSLGITVGNGLWAIERPQANFAADVWTLVVTLVSVLVLVAPLGSFGAALATLIGMVVGAGVRTVTLVRLMKTTPPHPRTA